MNALFVTIVGILISVAASLAGLNLLSIPAGLIAAVGAWFQYRETVPFERIIDTADWQKEGTDYRIAIPSREHKKRRPTATIYVGRHPDFEQAMCDVNTDSDDILVLRVSKPVSGKVVIK